MSGFAKCSKDSDCKQNEVCAANICLPSCSHDSDCKIPGTKCSQSTGLCGLQCSEDSQCGNSMKCDAVNKTCTLKCSKDSACPSPYVCFDGMCIRSKVRIWVYVIIALVILGLLFLLKTFLF